MAPRIHVNASTPSEFPHQAGIDDAKFEPELIPHLIPPLDLESGGTDHENLSGTVTNDEFQSHHPRLDGFPQTHVVSDKQVDSRHLDRTHDRIKLVVLDLDPAAERRLDVFEVGGRSGPPTDGVKKSVESVRGIEVSRRRQRHLFDDLGSRLDLPDDLNLLTKPVVLHRRERQQVLWTRKVGPKSRRRKRARLHVIDDPLTRSHLNELALLGRTDK